MKVSPTLPFQVVYSILEHEFLGVLFETFIVQINEKGTLTFQYQSISSKNAKDFDSGLSTSDYALITLIDSIQPDAIHAKFGDKKLKINDYIFKVFNKEKPIVEIKELIENFLERQRVKITELLFDKKVFEMGSDGQPTWREIVVEPEKAKVLFHFYRNEENTHYLPTIRHNNKNVEFKYKKSKLICQKPAWLLCEGRLYNFEKDVEGSKLRPFLNKNFIEVPRRLEEDFFKKFGHQLIASFDVYAKGFEIRLEESKPKAVIIFSELKKANVSTSLFENITQKSSDNIELEDSETITEVLVEEDSTIVFDLKFYYAEEPFSADHPHPTLVRQEKTENGINFYKIKRDFEEEAKILYFLKNLGFVLRHSKTTMPKNEALFWMSENKNNLENEGIILKQSSKDSKKYFTGSANLSVKINENIDWFDIHVKIYFGEFVIPFVYLKRIIAKGQKEFKLPNGEIAVLPDAWLSKYSELFTFSVAEGENEDDLKLPKHHLSLVDNLKDDSIVVVSMQNKLKSLLNFTEIDAEPLPKDFKGNLRPYQQAGYNWMHFLRKYKFGGCLADDMGLGKTVQTLAFLLSLKKINKNTENSTSLLVVPTSLIYNWHLEALKFTPTLKVHVFAGGQRDKNIALFSNFDLLITSYGIVRLDEDLFKSFSFNYIILDESQAIKNPLSATAISVKSLNSSYKLILTGTPIENSTIDLWSQMSFANPGLLGNLKYFKDTYQIPIEKNGNSAQNKKLFSIVKPFILRRDKKQVALDLPEKIESVRFSTMSEKQELLYEETKSFIRNTIINDATSKQTNSLMILQGLTRLRQIANHPLLVDDTFDGESGKLNDILYLIDEALENGRKILIFSQFVKYLAILKEHFLVKKIDFCYLDGSSTDRQKQVENFQNNDSIKIFLISLKAGGVGLNLTAADCVLILDPWWNPAAEAQAIDRAHRIGQTNTVFTYKFISKNTVEEKILLLQERKKDLAQGLISTEESFVKSLSTQDILSILE